MVVKYLSWWSFLNIYIKLFTYTHKTNTMLYVSYILINMEKNVIWENIPKEKLEKRDKGFIMKTVTNICTFNWSSCINWNGQLRLSRESVAVWSCTNLQHSEKTKCDWVAWTWLNTNLRRKELSPNFLINRGKLPLIFWEGDGSPLQYSCLENPMDGGAWWAVVHGVTKSRTRLSNFTFTFQFHALEKEMATHSSVLAWRIPGTAEPGGLPSMGSHRVGHDWSDLAAAASYFWWTFFLD